MIIHASEGVYFPRFDYKQKCNKYEILIELIDDEGDSISEDYESFDTEEQAHERIELINNACISSWEDYDKIMNNKEA